MEGSDADSQELFFEELSFLPREQLQVCISLHGTVQYWTRTTTAYCYSMHYCSANLNFWPQLVVLYTDSAVC